RPRADGGRREELGDVDAQLLDHRGEDVHPPGELLRGGSVVSRRLGVRVSGRHRRAPGRARHRRERAPGWERERTPGWEWEWAPVWAREPGEREREPGGAPAPSRAASTPAAPARRREACRRTRPPGTPGARPAEPTPGRASSAPTSR